MEQNLKEYLSKYNITFKIYEHPAVFTVEESHNNPVIKKIPGVRTKSLFLKDNRNNFYLVTLPGKKRLDIKFLKAHFKLKELIFASPQELFEELKIRPGSVSIFCIINSNNTTLIVDEEVYNAEEAGFHPNINTQTIVLDSKNIKKFYNSWYGKKEIIKL